MTSKRDALSVACGMHIKFIYSVLRGGAGACIVHETRAWRPRFSAKCIAMQSKFHVRDINDVARNARDIECWRKSAYIRLEIEQITLLHSGRYDAEHKLCTTANRLPWTFSWHTCPHVPLPH